MRAAKLAGNLRAGERARVGAADGAERRLSAGEFAEAVSGRLRAARFRFRRLRGKATYAAHAKATLTIAEVVELRRSSRRYLERNALIISPVPCALAPRLFVLRTGRRGAADGGDHSGQAEVRG